jgi:hypothetical protein
VKTDGTMLLGCLFGRHCGFVVGVTVGGGRVYSDFCRVSRIGLEVCRFARAHHAAPEAVAALATGSSSGVAVG